jgi:hypothetical protein
MTAETTTVDTPHQPRSYHPGQPTTCGQQLLSELWMLRLGHYNARQLEHIPDHADNTPSFFHRIHSILLMSRNKAAFNANPLDALPIKPNTPAYIYSWTLASYECLPQIVAILVRVLIGLWSVLNFRLYLIIVNEAS